jgi:hypothetical protein
VLALGQADDVPVRAVGRVSREHREALAEDTNSHLGAAAYSLVAARGRSVPGTAPERSRHRGVLEAVAERNGASSRIGRRRGSRKESRAPARSTSTLHVAPTICTHC